MTTPLSPWLTLPDSYRAIIVRNRIDQLLIAVGTQHERMMLATPRGGVSLLDLPIEQLLRGWNDLDFFFTGLRRMHRAVGLSRNCDRTGALRIPIKLFETRIAGVTAIRDAMEHFDDLDRHGRVHGLGIGMNEGSWWITYGDDINLHTDRLLMAAHDVHRAIRAVVDPEAARDPRGSQPMIDLTAASGASA